MRILIIDPYYPRFLAHALESIDSSSLGYEEMLTQLLRLRFGTSDFYSRHLRNLGHDAHDVVFNCEPLQRRWAEERGVAIGATLRIPARAARLPIIRRWLAPRDPLVEIALRQIRSARPDVLYFQVLNVFPPEILRSLKDCGCLIVGQIASPLPPADYLKAFDLILTSFPHYVDRLRDMGVASEYFRLGFDPIVLDELKAVPRVRSCTFVGGISPAHSARTRFLEQLARAVDMEFFGYGAETLAPSSPIRPKHRGEAWAMDMYRVLSESGITVNVHIDVAENFANNMRLYEATGCGALLITEEKDNLANLFRPGEEVVTYRSTDHAVEKIKYYLNRPIEAAAIARAGQQRTLKEHTYRHRMKELTDILSRYLRRNGK